MNKNKVRITGLILRANASKRFSLIACTPQAPTISNSHRPPFGHARPEANPQHKSLHIIRTFKGGKFDKNQWLTTLCDCAERHCGFQLEYAPLMWRGSARQILARRWCCVVSVATATGTSSLLFGNWAKELPMSMKSFLIPAGLTRFVTVKVTRSKH